MLAAYGTDYYIRNFSERLCFSAYEVSNISADTMFREILIQQVAPSRSHWLPSRSLLSAWRLSGTLKTCLPVSRRGNNTVSTAATNSRSHWATSFCMFLFFLSLGFIGRGQDCRLLGNLVRLHTLLCSYGLSDLRHLAFLSTQ